MQNDSVLAEIVTATNRRQTLRNRREHSCVTQNAVLPTHAEIEWVLTSARQFAADPALRTRSALARGSRLASPVHPAQIGRWESGTVPVHYQQVRHYEQTLGLPEHQLVCLIDQIHRDRQPAGPGRVVRMTSYDVDGVVEELAEKALSTDRMTGIDWDRLVTLSGPDNHVVMLRRDRSQLIARVVEEMNLSVGLEYSLRAEAAARLAAHPRAGGAVADFIRSTLADGTRNFYSEAASLAQFTADTAAAQVLIDHVQSPTNEHSWRWAASILAGMVRSGRVTEESALPAYGPCLDVVRDPTTASSLQMAALSLLHAIGVGQRVAALLRKELDHASLRLLLSGAPTGDATRVRIRRRVMSLIDEEFGRNPPDAQVLDRLLAGLASAESKARGHSLAVLSLSPYGPYVGTAYVEDLRDALTHGDLVHAHDSLSVLRSLSQEEHAHDLLAVLGQVDLPDTLIEGAGIALGNRRAAQRLSTIDGAVHATCLRLAATPEHARSRRSARGITYALGMRGRLDLLRQLRDTSVEDVWRGAANWWLAQPTHLLPSQ